MNTLLLARALPRLRAHGTVLLGSRSLADSCVWIVLEIVATEPRHVADARTGWLRLLRLLHRTVRRLNAVQPARPTPGDTLAALPLTERQAFVLLEVEGLGLAEAAFVTEADPLGVRTQITRARRHLGCGATVATPTFRAVDARA